VTRCTFLRTDWSGWSFTEMATVKKVEVVVVLSRRTTNIVRVSSVEASHEATGRVPYDPVIEARLVALSGRSVFRG
jgi:hypothetical protein